MTYSSWELRKPHHGSNLFVPVPNLSNQALKEGECRSVYFLSSSGGKKHSDAIFGVKIKGGKILGKDGQFLEPLSKVFGASDPDFSAASDLVATRLNSHTELSFVLQHNEQLKPFGTHYYHSACTLDIMSKELKPFKPPKQYKKDALLISAYGKLFHLALSAFEVYDPQACSWKSCSPFPHYQKEWSDSKMLGYAICYGCILVSVLPPDERDDEPRESPLWVYEVTSDEWREVKVPANHNSDYYYPFIDKGVVIDDTIYARSVDVIVAFSLIRTQMADGGMEYSVSKPQKLHGLRTCFDMDSDIYRKGEIFNMDPDCYNGSMRLVHLGGLNFCFLQTIMKYFETQTQRVFITTFDIVYKEGKRRIRTLDATIRKVDISSLGQFFIESGFTLECEEGKEIIGTSSVMQPADDPRLRKLQQAVNDKIRKQKRRQRQKYSKLSSRKITLLGNLFKPCREPKFGVY